MDNPIGDELHVLDDFGMQVLQEIKSKTLDRAPCLFDMLNNPCIKTSIAVYNKILELNNYDYLTLRVDASDCRIQYVHIGQKGHLVLMNV